MASFVESLGGPQLTVGIAIAVAVPLVIVVLAATTRGTLWDTAGYF